MSEPRMVAQRPSLHAPRPPMTASHETSDDDDPPVLRSVDASDPPGRHPKACDQPKTVVRRNGSWSRFG